MLHKAAGKQGLLVLRDVLLHYASFHPNYIPALLRCDVEVKVGIHLGSMSTLEVWKHIVGFSQNNPHGTVCLLTEWLPLQPFTKRKTKEVAVFHSHKKHPLILLTVSPCSTFSGKISILYIQKVLACIFLSISFSKILRPEDLVR